MRDVGTEPVQQEQTEVEAGPWLTHSLTENAVCSQFTFQTQHSTSQDGSSLECVAATRVGSTIFRMQGVEGYVWDGQYFEDILTNHDQLNQLVKKRPKKQLRCPIFHENSF